MFYNLAVILFSLHNARAVDHIYDSKKESKQKNWKKLSNFNSVHF